MSITTGSIYGSNNYKTEQTTILQFQELTIDEIKIENDTITGLQIPISSTEISNKEYVDDTNSYVSTRQIMDINTQNDVTYTGYELTQTIINRDPNGANRNDTFASVSQMLTSLGTYGLPNMKFKIILRNVASTDTNDSIILNTSNLNVIGQSENILLNPGATAIFDCIINDDLSISAYYMNTIYDSLSSIVTECDNGPFFLSGAKTFQFLPGYFSTDALDSGVDFFGSLLIPNAIYYFDSSGSIFILNSYSYEQLLIYLGLTPENIPDKTTVTFTFNILSSGDLFMQVSNEFVFDTYTSGGSIINFVVNKNINFAAIYDKSINKFVIYALGYRP